MPGKLKCGVPGALLASAWLAACVTAPANDFRYGEVLCESGGLAISADFPSGGQHGCTVGEDGAITLSVMAETSTSGPINPSPWYAFAVDAARSGPASVTLDYKDYEHRYSPWLRDGDGTWSKLDGAATQVSEDEHRAVISFDAARGTTVVAGHPLLTVQAALSSMRALAVEHGFDEAVYGRSMEGRELSAFTKGASNAGTVIIALTRQHPPEVTGAKGYQAFVEHLLETAPAGFWDDHLLITVPVANPDGVEHGHWRLNMGGVDLNRDWYTQAQPEIAALTAYLEREAGGRRVLAFLDFHSTWRTLIYSPPFENASPDAALLPFLQGTLDDPSCTQPEWIFGHNETSGTSKSWALATLGAPGITVEFGDDESEAKIACTAEQIAESLIEFALTDASAAD